MKKIITLTFLLLLAHLGANSQAIKYQTSVPKNNAEISSLNELTLQFDFSDIYLSLGGTEDDWGVCVNSFAYTEVYPDKEKTITLYEGTPENGIVLERIAETIKPPHAKFNTGNNITFNFSNIEIKPQQVYTVVVKYIFYAGKKGDTTWTTSTKQDFSKEPLVLTFKGAAQTQKVLNLEQTLTDLDTEYQNIPELKLKFNYGVQVLPGATATLREKDVAIANSTSIVVDPDDNKTVVITFPETTIYNGHTYDCIIPEGLIAIEDEIDVLNPAIAVQIKGASFRSFGIGRVYPANNSTAIIDNINVPFKFPTIEGSEWSYGFVNIQKAKYPMRLYKGTEEDGELVATINGEPNNSSLDFALTCDLEPGAQYTCVIDEGTVKAYAIGDPRQSYLKDYISEKVVLTYTTPALDQLGSMTIGCKDINDNDAVEHLGAVAFTCSGYEYNGTTYGIAYVERGADVLPASVYEVTAEGEKEICRFRFSKLALDDLVAQINTDLYEGKTYRVVIPAKTFKVNNSNFLGRYVFNEELSLTLTGKKSTESASEFTSGMVEGQNLSHVGVVSFYTAGDVKAIDNAKLEIRNGEETVASAPVRVVKEEGYTHIYADFSGEGHKPFATEKGVNYAAVLPQATVAEVANENLLNKEYAVPFTGMAPEAVYHNVTLSLDNAAAQTSAVEESKTVSFQLTPVDDLWKVESVENATLDEASGLYVTAPVTADTEVRASFALVNPVEFDFTTEVDEIEGELAYSIYSDGNNLVVSGVTGGDRIRVYTTGGTLMADKTVPEGMDTASISIDHGVYIVAVNEHAYKARH